MKPKTTSILIALLINLGLALGSPPGPRGANAVEQSGTILFHCCKKTDEGDPYCCEYCCYFRFDCLTDANCAPRR